MNWTQALNIVANGGFVSLPTWTPAGNGQVPYVGQAGPFRQGWPVGVVSIPPFPGLAANGYVIPFSSSSLYAAAIEATNWVQVYP